MIFRENLKNLSNLAAQNLNSHEAHARKYLELLDSVRNSDVNGEGEKVVILGAGIAGLSAAYELSKKGYFVTILEAQTKHIGGRTLTYRESETSYGELGAMRIPEAHLLTRKYVEEMGLKLRPFIQSNEKTFAFIRGKSYFENQENAIKKAFQLREDEKGKSIYQFWKEAVISIVDSLNDEEIKDLYAIAPKTKKIKYLDSMSLMDALENAGHSTEAIEILTSTWGLETSLHIGLTEFLREEIEKVWDLKFDEIIGGTDLLAQRLSKILDKKIKTGAKVFEISQDTDFAYVKYVDKKSGEDKLLKADWLICTIPLGALQKIKINDISSQKARAIKSVHYDSSTKILAVTKNRFWELEDKIYGGGSIYDTLMGYTWYPSDNAISKPDIDLSNSESVLLASYTWGQTARRVDSIPRKEIQKFIVSNLSNIHKSVRHNPNLIKSIVYWSWTDFEYSAGAYSFYRPYEHNNLLRDLKSREGKIFLAGEHCSFTHSWIQGALESAVDVCLSIMKTNNKSNSL